MNNKGNQKQLIFPRCNDPESIKTQSSTARDVEQNHKCTSRQFLGVAENLDQTTKCRGSLHLKTDLVCNNSVCNCISFKN